MSVAYMGKVKVEMKFKSNAKYGEKPENGSIFELKDNSLRICIHKYVGCGDALFLSCHALNIDKHDLRTEDFNEAVSKAKEVISAEMKRLREEAYRFCMDTHVEIVEY